MTNGNGKNGNGKAPALTPEIVTTMVREAVARTPGVEFVPATFMGTDGFGDGIVMVDTDDSDTVEGVHAQVIGPHPPYGARVVVAFLPGNTAYVLGEVVLAREESQLRPRVLIDSPAGHLSFYDGTGTLVGQIGPDRLWSGVEGGVLGQLDPYGGIRMRDGNDILRVQLSSSEGLTLREGISGVSGVLLASDGLVVIDPETGDRISITSGNTSAMPTPKWAGSALEVVGSSHPTPAVSSFATGDDLDIRWTCASAPLALGSQSSTPPTGWTERSDVNDSDEEITLATSSATRDPAQSSPSAASFTNTSGGWYRQNGHSIIVRGGGSTSPSYRSVTNEPVITTTAKLIDTDITMPSGVVENDIVVVFVAMASTQVPVGWVVPEGWKQLGVQVAGIGTSHLLASGVWYKRATASELSSYPVQINMSDAGVTKLHVTGVAIQNPYGFPAGLDIRRNNRSMPRGLVGVVNETSSSATWANTDLPQQVCTLTGVELLVGRSYRVAFDCPVYQHVSLSTTAVMRFAIQINTSGSWSDLHVVAHIQQPGGVIRNTMAGSRVYVPAADVTASFRLNITMSVNGSSSIQFVNSSVAPRSISVEDIGAVF